MRVCDISDRDLNFAIDGFDRLFNTGLEIPKPEASGAAYYYILLINNFPTTFNNIVKRSKNLSFGGIPRANLVNGKKELLKRGIIAEILPTMDQDNQVFRDNFKRETIFPISPKILWDVHSKTMTNMIRLDKYVDIMDQIYNKCYIEKFSIGRMRERIHKCHQNNNLTGCLTMYFSGMWVIYSLLENAKNTKILSMMLSGQKAKLTDHVNFYKMLIDQGVNIKAILDERYREKGTGVPLQPPRADIRYNRTNSQGTRRLTIADNLFALDGRKLLPFNRTDPSYVGTIYFDQDNINAMRNIFDDMWDSLQ